MEIKLTENNAPLNLWRGNEGLPKLTRILEIYVNFMRRSLVTADPRIA